MATIDTVVAHVGNISALATLLALSFARHWRSFDKYFAGASTLASLVIGLWLLGRSKNTHVVQDALIIFAFGCFVFFLKEFVACILDDSATKNKKAKRKHRYQKKVDRFKSQRCHK